MGFCFAFLEGLVGQTLTTFTPDYLSRPQDVCAGAGGGEQPWEIWMMFSGLHRAGVLTAHSKKNSSPQLSVSLLGDKSLV